MTFISYKYFILNTYDKLSNQEFLILALFLIFKYYYFSSLHKYIFKTKDEKLTKVDKLNFYDLLWRFLVTFFLISFVIFIGKINEDIGVILSCFPLLSLINSIILWKKTDNCILVSQTNSNILIGGTAIYMFLITYAFLITKLNIYTDIILSFFLTLLVYNLPIYLVLKKINKIKNTQNNIHISVV